MFGRFSAATIALAFALPMALASPTPPSLEVRTDLCNSGSVQCCNKTVAGGTPTASALAGLLGITGNIGEVLGITCSPVTAIGVSGSGCTQQTVCCTNNNFNGVIALGCTPINISF